MKLSEIHIRDPFILVDNKKYYLYGTRGNEIWGQESGLDAYVSDDLVNWSLPQEVFSKPKDFWADRDFWAPEVHKYRNKYYMFVSFKSETQYRGTQILVSDSPLGPFSIHSDGPVTPRDWECLDGTFYMEDGVPYMVFCHEWTQVNNGEICYIRLSDDLKSAVGEPKILFCADSCKDVVSVKDGERCFVTDGPFLYRTENGALLLLWSSFTGKRAYSVMVSYSDNNKIDGQWYHKDAPLFSSDGGHGMVFRNIDNQLLYVLHSPNTSGQERSVLFDIEECNSELKRKNV